MSENLNYVAGWMNKFRNTEIVCPAFLNFLVCDSNAAIAECFNCTVIYLPGMKNLIMEPVLCLFETCCHADDSVYARLRQRNVHLLFLTNAARLCKHTRQKRS